MKSDEQKKEERPHLEKLKAFLERSHLEYTEQRRGNTTVMEIRRAQKKEDGKSN
jgi:hypothetical protein